MVFEKTQSQHLTPNPSPERRGEQDVAYFAG